MSTYIDLAPGVGDVIEMSLDCVTQQSATGASIAKSIVPCKGRVVAVSAWVDTIGGTTKPTDYDIIVEKGTTDLISAAIPAVGSSTNAGPQMGTLSTTAATVAVAAGDILHLDGTLTGGASPTVDGIHAKVYIVRE